MIAEKGKLKAISMLEVDYLILYYKDRKCAVNENSSLRIVASVHYHAREIIL